MWHRRNRRRQAPIFRVPRVNWRGLTAVAALAAICGALWFTSVWLLNRPIETIVINGGFQRVSAIELEALVEPYARAGFLDVDLVAARRKLEALPWIAAAEIRRKWPGTLVIEISEQVPIACWGERGLLNAAGELFLSDADHVPAELPRLKGPPGTEAAVAARYFRLQSELERRGMAAVAMSLDERGAWAFELSDGVKVRLGANGVEERTERFLQALDNVLAHKTGEVAYIDMRYPNGFAVGWKKGGVAQATGTGESRPNA